ncbi:MAG: EAL domain-containing protein, partial [Planctomycetaceae bacterium]
NGTFVNGRRISTDTLLGEQDLIEFADMEFRIGREHAQSSDAIRATIQTDSLNQAWALSQFDMLMNQQRVVPYYQPLVDLEDQTTIGYEVLARSDLPGLSSPRDMFAMAERLNQETRLSELCRRNGVSIGRRLIGAPMLFLNTHPHERLIPDVLQSLRDVRRLAPDQRLVLEVHESAVTDRNTMRSLRDALNDWNIGLAYDDFGKGQARLLDLADVPPDYLKFDIGLIRDIHKAAAQQQQMVGMLVQMASDFGTMPLAEGIECAQDAAVCRQLGFRHAQGYHFGRPLPIEDYLAAV